MKTGMTVALAIGISIAPAMAQRGSRGAQPAVPPNYASSNDIDALINEKFGGLTFAAGPASKGGFGAELKGDNRLVWGPLDASGAADTDDGFKLPLFPFLGYATDDSWNSKAGSLNQASVELRPGLDGGIFFGRWDFSGAADPAGSVPVCTTDAVTHVQTCSAPPPLAPHRIAGYGFFGDAKYRYGTFAQNGTNKNVNQFLAGAGSYIVLQKGLDQPWIDIWPRLSVTYYAPVATNTPISRSDLPAGIKANYVQLEFKTGINFPARGFLMKDQDKYPFRLVFTYDGSRATTGNDKRWQNLWNVQLSTDILGSTFKPVVTYQSGKNGGLKYDTQFLLGIAADLL